MSLEWSDLNPLTWPGQVKSRLAKDAPGVFGDVDKNQYRFQHQQQIEEQINRGLGINRQAPQVGLGGDFRSAQAQQLNQLQGIASGQQQGAGELAVQRQVGNALASQQANVRMARGANAGMAMRQGANNAAAVGISGAGQAQQAAMGDQMNAQNLIAQTAAQGRGQDIQVQVANMDAQLRQLGMDDQARLAYLQQLTGMDAAQLQSYVAAKTGQQQMQGALLSGAGQIGAGIAMSDERVKTDVADADEDVDAMLDALHAKRYRYKNEDRHGKGERAGVMAQDLERSRAGRAVVVEVADGKAIDLAKAVSAALAASARLNKRLRALEAR